MVPTVSPAAGVRSALEDIVEVLQSQREGCKGLQLIFDDVLEAQRIDQGRLRLRDDELSLAVVLEETRSRFSREAASKDVSIVVELEEGSGAACGEQEMAGAASLPPWVRGDAVRIKQVVGNLLSNALQHTSAGGRVTVGARCLDVGLSLSTDGASFGSTNASIWADVPTSRDGSSGSRSRSRSSLGSMDSEGMIRAVVFVRDTGSGMLPDTIEGLFTPYKQARHGVEYTGSSSGLGLYISRGIARHMGGDLRARSKGLGHGSEFVFDFTVRKSVVKDSSGGQVGGVKRCISRAWRLKLDSSSHSTKSGGAGTPYSGGLS